MNVLLLHRAIESVCPIFGVSVGRVEDKGTWRIDFKDEATLEQRAAAQAEIDDFDPNAADAPDNIAALDERQTDEALDGLDRAIDAVTDPETSNALRLVKQLLQEK